MKIFLRIKASWNSKFIFYISLYTLMNEESRLTFWKSSEKYWVHIMHMNREGFFFFFSLCPRLLIMCCLVCSCVNWLWHREAEPKKHTHTPFLIILHLYCWVFTDIRFPHLQPGVDWEPESRSDGWVVTPWNADGGALVVQSENHYSKE